jgi:hypothetical protein
MLVREYAINDDIVRTRDDVKVQVTSLLDRGEEYTDMNQILEKLEKL